MKKQNVRTLALIICTFTYLLMGAAIFDAIESENEEKYKNALFESEALIRKKWNISEVDLKILETIAFKELPYKGGNQWKFAGAFYYATTVMTTIGYGHSTPSTFWGKAFTMAYAFLGIPLGLVMFQAIGERLNHFSSYTIRKVKNFLSCKEEPATETDLVIVVTALATIMTAGGAAAFSYYEKWTYFDSIYYCFVTLTTIGFGDMVALQQDGALDSKPEYVVFALIFILFGLALVAASMNLMVLRLVTLNTEDEKRDEAEALKAAQDTVHLEGDIITGNQYGLLGNVYITENRASDTGSTVSSFCSCDCDPAQLVTKSSLPALRDSSEQIANGCFLRRLFKSRKMKMLRKRKVELSDTRTTIWSESPSRLRRFSE